VKSQLESLPDGLDDTYDRILSKVSKQHCNDVDRLVEWLCYSAEILTVEQLAEVIAVNLEAKDGPIYDANRRYKPPQRVLVVCSGFVTVSVVDIDTCESACG